MYGVEHTDGMFIKFDKATDAKRHARKHPKSTLWVRTAGPDWSRRQPKTGWRQVSYLV